MSQWNRSGDSQFVFSSPYTAPQQPEPKRKKPRVGALGIAALAMSSALVGGIIGSSAFSISYINAAQPLPVVVNNVEEVNWVTGAASEAGPSVVTLSVNSSSSGGSGSGVLLTADGYILTNAHVVTLGGTTEDAAVAVQLWDGSVLSAELIGYDSVYDLAVIKIEAEGLKPITFSNSDGLNVGQNVVAIGAPLGLSSTVTQGIISALGRTIQVASSEVTDEPGLRFWTGVGESISIQVIQTDAAINPGNSGGALVDENGRLIGVNVAIATAGGGEAGSIGVGFAIPSNTAFRIAQEIMETGEATHGLLGALVRNNSDNGSSFSTGAYVEQVTEDGAAAAAGIRSGDVVVEFAGKRVTSSSDLTALVRAEPSGAEVEVEVLRDGERLSFTVTLGDAADLN
jgi:putative serine protease PepD